jgi:F0F1-type ATP synthase assembly protein I
MAKAKEIGAELAYELTNLLAVSAREFVKENQQQALKLGSETVRAILFSTVYERAPALPPLGRDATLKQRAERAKICAARDRVFQLVAAAERENAAATKALQGKAVDTALKISSQIASILLGVGIKAML